MAIPVVIPHFSPERIFDVKTLASSRQVLLYLAERVAEITNLESSNILHSFLQREKLGSTAVGNGIALPHTQLDGISASICLLLRSRAGIDFDTPDEIKVHLFFALVSPQKGGMRYLHDLSRMSRLLRQRGVYEQILAAKNGNEIWQVLVTACRQLSNENHTDSSSPD